MGKGFASCIGRTDWRSSLEAVGSKSRSACCRSASARREGGRAGWFERLRWFKSAQRGSRVCPPFKTPFRVMLNLFQHAGRCLSAAASWTHAFIQQAGFGIRRRTGPLTSSEINGEARAGGPGRKISSRRISGACGGIRSRGRGGRAGRGGVVAALGGVGGLGGKGGLGRWGRAGPGAEGATSARSCSIILSSSPRSSPTPRRLRAIDAGARPSRAGRTGGQEMGVGTSDSSGR